VAPSIPPALILCEREEWGSVEVARVLVKLAVARCFSRRRATTPWDSKAPPKAPAGVRLVAMVVAEASVPEHETVTSPGAPGCKLLSALAAVAAAAGGAGAAACCSDALAASTAAQAAINVEDRGGAATPVCKGGATGNITTPGGAGGIINPGNDPPAGKIPGAGRPTPPPPPPPPAAAAAAAAAE